MAEFALPDLAPLVPADSTDAVRVLYGTVAQLSPFKVLVDGDSASVPAVPCVAAAVDDRVVMLLQRGILTAIATVGGGDSCPYAVGDLYTTTSATAPGTRWPGTTWEAYGAGRVLVGKAASGTFTTVGATGGEETHTLTIAEMPSHTHPDVQVTAWGGYGQNSAINGLAVQTQTAVTGGATGGGGAHNNLQPYIVVNIWRRTA